MVVHYSQTVNKYTSHDAYPLPNIDKQVCEIAKRTIFSIFDLKPAYYQVPRCAADCSDIAFEANRNRKKTSIHDCLLAILMMCLLLAYDHRH